MHFLDLSDQSIFDKQKFDQPNYDSLGKVISNVEKTTRAEHL